MGTQGFGVQGVGVYLPEEIRQNDWWSAETVAAWSRPKRAGRREEPPAHASEGMKRTLEAMGALAADPFKGALERRVIGRDQAPSDMGVAAARDAIERAGIDPRKIGLLLTYDVVPDYLGISNASKMHKQLGLREECLSMGVEGACNAFLMQLTIAENYLRTGAAEYALLVQTCAATRILRPEDPHSAWFGDGATAVVLGPVGAGRGLLAANHRTDGSLHKALVIGCPGKRWHEDGSVVLYVENGALAMTMLLRVADLAKQSVDQALAGAGCTAADVGFYGAHQATKWFRPVTQEYIGMVNARAVDTFPFLTSLSAANIPMSLALGEREGLLRDGDLVALHTGGSGITWSGAAIRWGR